VYYLVSTFFFVHKKEKWAKLIRWCPPLSHKLSNVPVGTKRLGTTAVNVAVRSVKYFSVTVFALFVPTSVQNDNYNSYNLHDLKSYGQTLGGC
jgi:hypothetical protein